MDAADLSPVPEAQRTQSPFDLFLIFAAANVVATTMQTGAALGLQYGGNRAIGIALAGALFGALIVAILAPVGSRTGVPSMIAARAPLGYRGAQLVSGLLYLTNFAWIAINNQIAASVCAQVFGGPDSARIWAAVLGIAAIVVVARGPRAVGYADRVAVPVMLVAGAVLTYAVITHDAVAPAPLAPLAPSRFLEPRRRDRLPGVVAPDVCGLLALHAVGRGRGDRGFRGARDTGALVDARGLEPRPDRRQRRSGNDAGGRQCRVVDGGPHHAGVGDDQLRQHLPVVTGVANALASLDGRRFDLDDRAYRHGTWIDLIRLAVALRRTDGAARVRAGAGRRCVPGALCRAKKSIDIKKVYDRAALPAFNLAGIAAWMAGFIVYRLAAPIGATLPALATSMIVYAVGSTGRGGRLTSV